MKGLAQTLAQPQPQAVPSIEEVIALLMEGANPEELVQMGVPPELIMQAIEIIEQQMSSQGAPAGPSLPSQGAPVQQPGLAQTMAMGQ